jgi:hypothetical protein
MNKLIRILALIIGIGYLFIGCYKGAEIGDTGGVKGQMVQSDGVTPVVSATVRVVAGQEVITSTTDNNGNFALKLGAGKTYQIIGVTSSFRSASPVSVRVIANKTIDVGKIILKGVGSIVGRVVDENNNPVSNARIQLVDSQGRIIYEGLADSAGNINLNDIPEGTYTIIITSENGSLSVTIPNVVITPNSTISLGTVVAVTASASLVTVTGNVLDSNGVALSGVSVEFQSTNTYNVAKKIETGVGGSFSTNIIPDTYNIKFNKSGYYSFTLYSQKITTNNYILPTIVLASMSEPTGGLKGKVIANGTPQDGAIITLKSGDLIVGSTVTPLMGNGIFILENIPVGTYTLIIESPAIQPIVIENVQIIAGKITDLGTLTTGAKSGVKGLLKDQDGAAVSGATVVLKDGSGNVVSTTTSDVRGSFSFDNVTPGNGYTIEILKDGYDTAVLNNGGSGYSVSIGSYTIVGSDSNPIIFNKSIGDIKLTFKDSITGAPIAGLAVVIDGVTKTTNANGIVIFEDLASHKNYVVSISGSSLYKDTQITTNILNTNQLLESTINLARKEGSLTGSGIKLGDSNSAANTGSVRIVNTTLGIDITIPIENGGFSAANLPYGSGYTITLTYSDDYNPIIISNITISSSNVAISTGLVFSPSSNAKSGIKVTVKNTAGSPLSGIKVKIGTSVYTTNEEGVINTGLSLALGNYDVVVNDGGYEWRYNTSTVSVSANLVNVIAERVVTIDKKKGSVTVTVNKLDSSGNYIELGAGAQVILNGVVKTAGVNGSVTFSDVYYDDYNFSVSLGGYISTQDTIRVNNSTVSKVIGLYPDTTAKYRIYGNITGGDGISTNIVVKNGTQIVKTATVSGSTYEVRDLPNGITYTVIFEKQYFNSIETNVILSGSDVNYNVVFDDSGNGTSPGSRKKGSLTGSVSLQDSAGENGTITISIAGPSTGSTTVVAPSGNFSFANIYEGQYTVTVNYTNYLTANKSVNVSGTTSAGQIVLAPNYATVNVSIISNPSGFATSGAILTIGSNSYTADSTGKVFLTLKAGTYNYTSSKQYFVSKSGSFNVTAGETKNVSISMDAYATIKGYIKNSTTVFTNAIITISGPTNMTTGVNSSGYFEIRVAPGSYTLTVSNLGAGYDNLTDTFTLAAGQVYDINSDFDPENNGGSDIGSGDYLQPYTLNVSVRGDGVDLGNVSVSIGTTSSTTNPSGNVSFIVNKNTTYSVAISNLPVGYVNKSQNVTITNKTTNVSFNLTSSKINLSSNAPGTVFKVYDPSNNLVATYSAGTYNINPNTYRVNASSTGYKPSEQTKAISEGATVAFSFTLTQITTVTGKIVSNTGTPVSGAAIAFAGPVSTTVYSNASGDFQVQLDAGSYNYQVTATNYQTVTGSVNVSGSSMSLGNITINALGSITGQIVSWTNMNLGIVGANVTLYDSNGNRVSSTVTGSNGVFNMSAPAGNNMSLRIDPITYNGVSYATTSKSGIRVSAGSVTDVGKIYMPIQGTWADGILKGKVVDAVSGSRTPIVNATIEVRIGGANGPIQATATTSSQGTFQTTTITGGIYTVVVKATGYINASYENIVINGTTDVGVLALSPTVDPGEIRITLKWMSDGYDYVNKTVSDSSLAEKTRDLDGHLVGPKVGGGYFHVYWNDKNADGVTDGSSSNGTTMPHPYEAWQDIDDTVYCTRNGETITIKTDTSVRAAGTYSYTIHNWTSGYNQNDWLSKYSNAVVSVYDSRGLLSQVSIEPNTGWASNGWKVFEINIAANKTYTVAVINQPRPIYNYATSDGVRSGSVADIISSHLKGATK